MEFFFIKDPFGKWTFPKGHQELGETLAETAIREIREETGLTGLRYVAPLGRTSFRFRRGKTVIDKSVHLFLFEAAPDAKENLPGEEGILEARWFHVTEASTVSGYRNLDVILKKALELTGSAGATSVLGPGLL
ncbi:MAG: NUDIX domain-containing protein [Patescibacteria group bacterium]